MWQSLFSIVKLTFVLKNASSKRNITLLFSQNLLNYIDVVRFSVGFLRKNNPRVFKFFFLEQMLVDRKLSVRISFTMVSPVFFSKI